MSDIKNSFIEFRDKVLAIKRDADASISTTIELYENSNLNFKTVKENGLSITNIESDLLESGGSYAKSSIATVGEYDGKTLVTEFPVTEEVMKVGLFYPNRENPSNNIRVINDNVTVDTDRADGDLDINRWTSRNIFKFDLAYYGFGRRVFQIPLSALASNKLVGIDGHVNTVEQYPYPEEIIMVNQKDPREIVHFINVQYEDGHYGYYAGNPYNFMLTLNRTRIGVPDDAGEFEKYISLYVNNIDDSLCYVKDGYLNIPIPDNDYALDLSYVMWDCRVMWRQDAPSREIEITYDFECVETDTTDNYILVNGEYGLGRWTNNKISNTSRNWWSICYGANKFVIVARSSNYSAYSLDGITWIETSIGNNRNWYSVCYGNAKFVAVSNGTSVGAYSLDGITWSETTISNINRQWRSVCYGKDRFVAISIDSMIAAYSTNGVSWLEFEISNENKYWCSVCYGNDKFVALIRDSAEGAYSINGTSWYDITLVFSSPRSWRSVCYGKDRFVAVAYGSNQAIYSLTGVNWVETVISQSNSSWRGICYGVDRFVAVCDKRVVSYSLDGIIWNEMEISDVNRDWNSIIYGKDKFVAVISNSTTSAYSERVKLPYKHNEFEIINTYIINSFLTTIQYFCNRYFSITSDGIVSSEDLTNWSIILPKTVDSISSAQLVRGDALILVCINNTTYYASIDGVNWNTNIIPTNMSATNHTIKYVNGRFFSLNHAAKELKYTMNGVNWTSVNLAPVSSESFTFNDIIYITDRYIVSTTKSGLGLKITDDFIVSPLTVTFTMGKLAYHNNTLFSTTGTSYTWSLDMGETWGVPLVLDTPVIAWLNYGIELYGLTSNISYIYKIVDGWKISEIPLDISETTSTLASVANDQYLMINYTGDKIIYKSSNIVKEKLMTTSEPISQWLPGCHGLQGYVISKVIKSLIYISNDFKEIEFPQLPTISGSSVQMQPETIIYHNSKYYASCVGELYKSSTGKTWSGELLTLDDSDIIEICSGHNMLVGITINGTIGVLSDDETDWVVVNSPTGLNLTGLSLVVGYFNNVYIAIAYAAGTNTIDVQTVTPKYWYSHSGYVWVEVDNPIDEITEKTMIYGQLSKFRNIIYVDNAMSYDGIHWISTNHGIIRKVSDDNICVGVREYYNEETNSYSSDIMYSTDGFNFKRFAHYDSDAYAIPGNFGNFLVIAKDIESSSDYAVYRVDTSRLATSKRLIDNDKYIMNSTEIGNIAFPFGVSFRGVTLLLEKDSFTMAYYLNGVRYDLSPTFEHAPIAVVAAENLALAYAANGNCFVIDPSFNTVDLTNDSTIITENVKYVAANTKIFKLGKANTIGILRSTSVTSYEWDEYTIQGANAEHVWIDAAYDKYNDSYIFICEDNIGYYAVYNGITIQGYGSEIVKPNGNILCSGIATNGDGFIVTLADSNSYRYFDIYGKAEMRSYPDGKIFSKITSSSDEFIVFSGSIIGYSNDGLGWRYENVGKDVQSVCDNVILAEYDAIERNPLVIYKTEENLNTVGDLEWSENVISSTIRDWRSMCYGKDRFVAVANGTYSAYSLDGITWIENTISSTSRQWWSVCYGNNRFVIVAQNSNYSAYSLDGITWIENTISNTSISRGWYSVCYGKDRFVAVATSSNYSAYSLDGITWIENTISNTSRGWRSVCYGKDRFVTIAWDSNYSAYSLDGITWIENTISSTTRDWGSVCYGKDRFVAVAFRDIYSAYSLDGITWIENTISDTSRYWNSVCYGKDRFVAVVLNSNISTYSLDGITWLENTISNILREWRSVCYGNDRFVTVCNDDGYGAYALNPPATSIPFDKSLPQWSTHTIEITKTQSNQDGFVMYYTDQNTNKTHLYHSINGIDWDETSVLETNSSNKYIVGFCVIDNTFMLYYTNDNNQVLRITSFDGIRWNQPTIVGFDDSYTDYDLLGIYQNTLYMKVVPQGSNGVYIITSEDTMNFKINSSGSSYIGLTSDIYVSGRVINDQLLIRTTTWVAYYEIPSIYRIGKFYSIISHLDINPTYFNGLYYDSYTESTNEKSEILMSGILPEWLPITVNISDKIVYLFNIEDRLLFITDMGEVYQTYNTVDQSNENDIKLELLYKIEIEDIDNTKYEFLNHWNGICLIKYMTTDGISSILRLKFYPTQMEIQESSFSWSENTISSTSRSWNSVCCGNDRFVTVAYDSTYSAYSLDGITWVENTISSTSRGWRSVCYGKDRFVTVAYDSTYSAYSLDGIIWVENTISSTSREWRSVCYGKDRFVTVTMSSNYSAYSLDSITWIENTIGSTSRSWNSVCYGNDRFVAVAYNSNISAYSLDGITWIENTISGTTRNWYSVCYGNDRFVAVSWNSTYSAYSLDGITWIENTISSTSRYWQSVCYGNDRFVTISYNSTYSAYSLDGITWIENTISSTSREWWSVCYGSDRYVAVTNGSTYSVIGESTSEYIYPEKLEPNINEVSEWSENTIGSTIREWYSVCYGKDRFVAVSRDSTYSAYSLDGITWIENMISSTIRVWCSVCYGKDRFVSVAYNSNYSAYSLDGITWIENTISSTSGYWQSVCYGKDRFVAMASSSNYSAYSLDGITWIETTISSTNRNWRSVCYGNDIFVTVIDGSTYSAYSLDGITWVENTISSASRYWRSVCYGNDRFVAVADISNYSAYSLDGITWVENTISSTRRNWFSVCYGKGRFVAVCNDDGYSAYSLDGITWIENTISSTSRSWRSVCYGKDRFVTVAYSSNYSAYFDILQFNTIISCDTITSIVDRNISSSRNSLNSISENRNTPYTQKQFNINTLEETINFNNQIPISKTSLYPGRDYSIDNKYAIPLTENLSWNRVADYIYPLENKKYLTYSIIPDNLNSLCNIGFSILSEDMSSALKDSVYFTSYPFINVTNYDSVVVSVNKINLSRKYYTFIVYTEKSKYVTAISIEDAAIISNTKLGYHTDNNGKEFRINNAFRYRNNSTLLVANNSKLYTDTVNTSYNWLTPHTIDNKTTITYTQNDVIVLQPSGVFLYKNDILIPLTSDIVQEELQTINIPVMSTMHIHDKYILGNINDTKYLGKTNTTYRFDRDFID